MTSFRGGTTGQQEATHVQRDWRCSDLGQSCSDKDEGHPHLVTTASSNTWRPSDILMLQYSKMARTQDLPWSERMGFSPRAQKAGSLTTGEWLVGKLHRISYPVLLHSLSKTSTAPVLVIRFLSEVCSSRAVGRSQIAQESN